MRITEAAKRLGTSPRMLRYRESLGLLPPTREQGGHRRFTERELRAVAVALTIEKRYDVSPAELAFGLRVLAEPGVRAAVQELGERIGRLSAPPTRALDFEQEKALRLLQAQTRRLPLAGRPNGRSAPAQARPAETRQPRSRGERPADPTPAEPARDASFRPLRPNP